MLFLIGWIEVGGRKSYITNIIDNILVALFAIMGDGLAPFRMIDTYHMIFIAHYHHVSRLSFGPYAMSESIADYETVDFEDQKATSFA